jgi:MYXO-CTERM domain-containing protein
MVGQLRAAAFGVLLACFIVCISAPFMFGRDSFRTTGACGGLGLVLLAALLLTRRRD